MKRAFDVLLVFGSFLVPTHVVFAQPAPASSKPKPAARKAPVAKAPGLSPLGRKVKVGTTVMPPFSYKNDAGEWDGLAVDIWQRIATARGWSFDYVEMPREALTVGLTKGDLDVVATGIDMTREREARYDFTHMYHQSGQGIAVPLKAQGTWLDAMMRFFSPPFLLAMGGIIGMVLFFGTLVWLVERRRNADDFGGSAAKGIGAGFWFSAVTMTTVGYGDKAPRTVAGRAITLTWMFLSLLLVTAFTGAVASMLTVNQLESPVRGRNDLGRHKTLTIANSISAESLKKRNIAFRGVANLDAALDALANNQADAVVFDAAVLRYRASHDYTGQIRVLRDLFDRQQFGLAVRNQSRLREPIIREMLRVMASPNWTEDVRDHLGR